MGYFIGTIIFAWCYGHEVYFGWRNPPERWFVAHGFLGGYIGCLLYWGFNEVFRH